ncbi:MAG: GNAT family N-acetyltransferase [Ramlibacter sp.]
MQIRHALEAEAVALSAIAVQAKAHSQYSAAQLDVWRKDLSVDPASIATSPTFVAEVEGEIAGFYSMHHENGTWDLENLWVLPSHMRHGVGRALILHAAEFAAQAGAGEITIDADPYAQPFYVACGAQTVGTVAAPIEGEPDRQRPQMVLRTQQPNPSIERMPSRVVLSAANIRKNGHQP